MLRKFRAFGVLCPLVCLACDRSKGAGPVADAAPEGGPTVLFPRETLSADAVTGASPSWDAGPRVVADGAVDGASLRARARARIAADKSPVTMLEGGSARELGQRLCEAVVPKRAKETPILIKPNMGGFEWFKDPETSGGDDGVHGRTTDSEFVRGVVLCLKARGHSAITIAEGFGHSHKEWVRLVKVSGYEAMAREEGVPLVAMDDDGVFDQTGAEPGKPLRVKGIEGSNVPTLLMPKILAEHLERGLVISAPKIKAHRFGVVSVAIKGMQGTVMMSDASPAFHQKWRMHKELSAALKLLGTDPEAGKRAYLDSLHVFAERMVDLLEIQGPHVVLAEGAPAMGGDGFGKRWPSAENVAIGGTNPVLVDRVAAAYLGLWNNAELAKQLGGHRTSPLLETAAARLHVDIARPSVVGNGASLLDKPRPVHFVSMSNFALHSDDTPPEKAPTGRVPPPSLDGGTSPLPEATAAHVEEGSLRIDGKVDKAWESVPAVSFTTDWSGAATDTRTKVRLAWNERALYALWELEGAHVNTDAERPNKVERLKLWEEDCVEMFLGRTRERSHYYEVEVGPLGHFLDVEVDRSKRLEDVGWSSRPEIATVIDRAGAKVTIEVALRAPEIVQLLAPGERLTLALYRLEGKAPRKFLAWSPTRTKKPDFHVPQAFGTLLLSP